MAKLTVNIGTSANDRTGDNLRTAFNKINTNFTELYTALGLDDASLNLGAFEFTGSVMTTTDSSAITIDQAVTVSSDLTVGGDVVPSTDLGSSLGSATKRFKDLYVSSNTIYIGNTTLSVTPGGSLAVGGTSVSSFDGAFSSLTGKPTTVAGYGITDALTSVPAQSFASLTGKPTTISGYGITDAQSALVSGTSIKTINGTSLLGSGDVTISGGGGLADVVDDTTPQLGGNLDVNGNSIVSVSGGDINLAPNGAGEVTVTGNATISNVAKAYQIVVTNSNAALSLGDGTGSEGYMNIYLNNVSGGAKHIIQSFPTAGGGFAFQNLVNDQAITFETKNSSGTTKTPLILNGDGSVISGGAFKLYNYADATARDAALTSPEAGMMVYITDTNKAQVYNGTSWIDLH